MIQDIQIFVLRRNDKIDFNINNQKHSLTVNVITPTSVSITITSKPQEFEIKKGKRVDVDINGEGINDLRVTVKDISNGVLVTLLLEKINKQNYELSKLSKIIKEENSEHQEIVKEHPKSKDFVHVIYEKLTNKRLVLMGTIMLIFAVLIFVLLILYHKKKKSRTKRFKKIK